MKPLLLIFLLLSIYSCENKNLAKPIKKTISQNEVLIIPEIKGVQRIDTTLNNFCIQEIKSYDKNQRLLRIQETNLCQSNSNKIYNLIKLYDTNNVLRYKLNIIGIGPQNCTELKFDESGKLKSKKNYTFDNHHKLVKTTKKTSR